MKKRHKYHPCHRKPKFPSEEDTAAAGPSEKKKKGYGRCHVWKEKGHQDKCQKYTYKTHHVNEPMCIPCHQQVESNYNEWFFLKKNVIFYTFYEFLLISSLYQVSF